ncbi:class I SAM-dependent methyltransferase [Neomicrococcus lactis]
MSQEHYFSDQPNAPEKRRTITADLGGGHSVAVQTSNAIFSPGGVDKGTVILLKHAPQPPSDGHFLDIGCGWGPLTLRMALESPSATVFAVDVNERSRKLTADNAASLGLTSVKVFTPEDLPADETFDLIWSNPPIRVGKEVLHAILLQWLPRLNVGGIAYLVVQKNLGSDSLQQWIATTLGKSFTVDRLTTDKGFRIISVLRNA